MSTQKDTPSSFKPEPPRRVVDMPSAAPARRPPATEGRSEITPKDGGNRLLVGSGISLTGEITACDHLVVEGKIEARIKDCRTIEVADGGVFKGSAEIEEADIGGRFEGDLTVKGRLTVRGTGVVSGALRYGELEVVAGGRVIGTVDPLESTVASIREVPSAAAAADKAGE